MGSRLSRHWAWSLAAVLMIAVTACRPATFKESNTRDLRTTTDDGSGIDQDQLENEDRTPDIIDPSVIPAIAADSGMLLFSIADDVDGGTLAGYVLGHEDELKVQALNYGLYCINGVAPGTHDVVLTASARSSLTAQPRARLLAGLKFSAGARTDRAKVALPVAGSVSGRILRQCEDSHAGISLNIPGSHYHAETNGAGEFAIAGLPGGHFTVTAAMAAFRSFSMTATRVVTGKNTALGQRKMLRSDLEQAGTLTVHSPLPAEAGAGAAMAAFTIEYTGIGGETHEDWCDGAAVSAWKDSACTVAAAGKLSSPSQAKLGAVKPDGGKWTFSDLQYDSPGSRIYLKFASGSQTLCDGPITIRLGACKVHDGRIWEREVLQEKLDYLAVCRRSPITPDDIDFSVARNSLCAEGWHLCYPSEYSNILRATLEDPAITFKTASNSYVNVEGVINNTSKYNALTKSKTGTDCIWSDIRNYRLIGKGHEFPGYAVYADCPSLRADATFPAADEDINTAAFRPDGMRFISQHFRTKADGAICCRNDHAQFHCADYNGDQPGCQRYGDACVWQAPNCATK